MTGPQRARLAVLAAAALAMLAAPGFARDDDDRSKGKGRDGGGQNGGQNGGQRPKDKDGQDPPPKAKEKEKDKPKDGAGGAGDPPQKEKPKDPKDSAEGRECAAIGAEFAARKSKSLVARVRAGGKLTLRLDGESGSYAADQAAEVLDRWFKDKDVAVKLKAVDGTVASFDLTVRRSGGDREVKHQLLVEVRKKEKGEGFHLVRIEKV